MADRVRQVRSDHRDVGNFYNKNISPRRYKRLGQFYADELELFFQLHLDNLGRQGKVDFLVLRNYLERGQRQLNLDKKFQHEALPFLPFTPSVVSLSAQILDRIAVETSDAQYQVEQGKLGASKQIACKAAHVVAELCKHLQELLSFYSIYDPLFDWWATTHGERQTPPCNNTNKLNFGQDWKKALEHVKTKSIPPGEQTQLVLQLAREGTAFVREHYLVTVPDTTDETYRVFIMSPE
ncbi:hypothetical protein FZEAL_7647 [Fusarium zealandicum]|uniref:Uncharacterized protein n=1 Tax=Fusarium zealandicum TaxID=1053134 RepID=A0A8H4XIN3_9HYPO|nr:hypothetical protein FZEAL_7647 [Fusarium zealandicum]